VIWTTGRILPVRELREETGIPILVDGAQSVGAIPVAAAGLDYLTISGPEVAVWPDATGALVVANPDRLKISAPSYFSQADYEPDGQFRPKPGAPASTTAGGRRRPSQACSRRSRVARRGPSTTLPQLRSGAASFSPSRSSSSARRRPSARPRGVPSRRRPAAVVESLHDADVHVREIPGTGLIRVSCGWWTSDGDLDRLLAGLPS
jgi:selenocysteine lyase/cysteine desulfurase